MNLKMNIGYNKTTKQLIGYSTPKNGRSLVVTAYAVDDLERKFEAAKPAYLKEQEVLKEAYEELTSKILRETV